MHQPKPIDVSLAAKSIISESTAGPSTEPKQPWEAPALDALPLSETYNAPNFNSDGPNGS